MMLLEVCVDSVESAINAKHGGADRLELCSNLIIGGTTPSEFLYEGVRKNCDIKIHVLIRPRFGDFCYTDEEFNIIRGEVKRFRQLGADGVVIGILNADGTIDMGRMGILMEEAKGMKVTLHRAIDMCEDPFKGLEDAISLSIDTILTSGQCDNCVKGKSLLWKLRETADGRINILAGAGVDPSNIELMYKETGITMYHMSGKVTLDSNMVYRKEGVNMGLPSLSEYDIWQTSEEKVRDAMTVLQNIEKGGM